MKTVTEPEFAAALTLALSDREASTCNCVTGPGRSGAIAAVYASHLLKIPFLAYGQDVPKGWRVLLVDTAMESGKTMRKAARRYAASNPVVVVAFREPPRVAFWYEAQKPQRYKHEVRAELPRIPSIPEMLAAAAKSFADPSMLSEYYKATKMPPFIPENPEFYAPNPSLPRLRDRIADFTRHLDRMANAPSRARRRAEAMGFVFHQARIEPWQPFDLDRIYTRFPTALRVKGSFQCVCGQVERYEFLIHPDATAGANFDDIDPALMLERHGSFSREHLLSDGYPPEVVDEIIAKGKAFDKAYQADTATQRLERKREERQWLRRGTGSTRDIAREF